MALSVNTNTGAMAALQSLSATNRDLSTTQSRINTGMNVAS
ncbi:MAG TPA: flagellin, partial [Sphingomicrobium sp.]